MPIAASSIRGLAQLSALSLLALAFGCGGSTVANSDGGDGGGGGPDLSGPPALKLAAPCTDTVEDVYKLPPGLPPFDTSRRGEVVRCAIDRTLSLEQIKAALEKNGYSGAMPTTGVTVHRIAYRTERVAAGKGPKDGLSSALVMLPQQARAAGALVVVGHGTVGLADKCAPSLEDQLTASATHTMNLAFASAGLITIAPDYAGFGYGGVHGWSLAEDEAHSLLDATRAMKRLLPPANAPTQVALVGHSQGGHAVLSTQALAAKYGLEGKLVGVVGFAPLWIAPRSWAAATSLAIGLTTKDSPGPLSFSLLYFYGHGELYDGPGGGLKMFQAPKQAQVKTMLTTLCLGELYDQLPTLGAAPADFYDAAFVNPLSACAIFPSQKTCGAEPGLTWVKRFADDRPAIDAGGAPIVILQGGGDKTLPPDRAQCGFDKIAADLKLAPMAKATLTVCGDKEATHGSVVERNAGWVTQWLSARFGLGTDPPACKGTDELKPANGPLTCATPPPNED